MQSPKTQAKPCCKYCGTVLDVRWPHRPTRVYCSNAHRAAYNRQKGAPPAEAQEAKRQARKAERAGQLPQGFTVLLDDVQEMREGLAEVASGPAELASALDTLSEFLQTDRHTEQGIVLHILKLEVDMFALRMRYLADLAEGIYDQAVDVVCVTEAGDAELDALLYPAQVNYADQVDDDQDDDEAELLNYND